MDSQYGQDFESDTMFIDDVIAGSEAKVLADNGHRASAGSRWFTDCIRLKASLTAACCVPVDRHYIQPRHHAKSSFAGGACSGAA